MNRRLFMLWRISLLVLALAGAGSVIFLTRQGPGVSGDAVHYMEGAENLLRGYGYSRLRGDGQTIPITGFPPFFSVILAGVSLPAGSALVGGRYLNAFLFTANIWMTGWLVQRLTRSFWASLVGAGFVLFFYKLILSHAWIMSEALYLFLSLCGLASMLAFWESRQRRYLVLAGIFACCSTLTRYVGVSLIAALGLVILLMPGEAFKRRLENLIWFGAVSSAPLFAWLARNALLAGSTTARTVAYHLPTRDLVVVFFDEISSWLVPNALRFAWRPRLAVFGLILLVAAGLFLWSIYRRRYQASQKGEESIRFQVLLGVYASFYLFTIGVNQLTLDVSTSDTGLRRYLLPLYAISVLWLVLVFYHAAWQRNRGPTVRWVITILSVGLLGLYTLQSASFVKDPGFVFGYTDRKNASPEVVGALQAIPAEYPLITNDYELIYYLAGRAPFSLPKEQDHFTGQINPEFELELDDIELMLRKGGVLVISDEDRGLNPAVEELVSRQEMWQRYHRITFYKSPGEN